MENNVILWHQSPISLGEGTLSHNGQLIANNQDSYRMLFNSLFQDNDKDVTLYKSDTIQVYRGEKGFSFFGNFTEKDETDRRIAFAAMIEADSKKQVLPLLQKEASIHKMTITQEDLAIILSVLYRTEILICLCGIVVLILCIILISIFL